MPKVGMVLLSFVMLIGLWTAPTALAGEEPRRGGVFQVALAGDPPSLDMHQEQTFMVAIPLGQGHKGGGRYAQGKGVNPLELLVAQLEGAQPAPAWNATRVRVARVSAQGGLVTAGHPEGSYRSDLIEI